MAFVNFQFRNAPNPTLLKLFWKFICSGREWLPAMELHKWFLQLIKLIGVSDSKILLGMQ